MRPMSSVNKDIYAKYVRAGSIEVDGTMMARAGVVATWSKESKYDVNALVFHAGNLWRANAAIPAKTTFEDGSHGRTWTRLNTKNDTYDMSETGMGFGRMHIWNNRVIMVGANAGHIHNYGGAAGSVPRELLPTGDAPHEWLKVYDTCANFIGLGSDGCLYIAGSNACKLLLGTVPNTNVAHYVRITHPAIFSENRKVLDFWATDVDENGESTAVTVICVVDDNGTNRIYSWGNNDMGQCGNGTTAVPDAPVLVVVGHTIRQCDMVGNVSMFVRDDGTVWGCGGNASGQLGIGTNVSPAAFTQVLMADESLMPEAAEVHIGWATSMGCCAFIRLMSGEVLSAGVSSAGNLGDGQNVSRDVFDYVKTSVNTHLSNVVEIRTASIALVARTVAGSLYVTGANYTGYWGTGETAATTSSWAVSKWEEVDQMWVYRAPRMRCRLIFHQFDSSVYMGAGDNTGFALSAVSGSETTLNVAQRVMLPKGEAISKLKFLGAAAKTAQYLGLQVLTASGRIYACGRLGTPILGNADYLQWLTPIVGFS